MSKTGQASSEPAPAMVQASAGASARARANRARSGRAIVRLILRPALAILVLGVLAALGLALRLAAGPMEVTWLAHALTPLPLGGGTGGASGRQARVPAAALEVGRAWLAWDGFHAGAGAPVILRLQDVAIRRPDGAILDRLDRARIGLTAAGLVRGVLSVEEVALTGARLTMRRDGQGGLDPGLAPAGGGTGGGSGPVLRWGALRAVHVADLQMTVHDLMLGRDWSLRDVEIDGRPGGAGIVGRVGATLLMADRRAVLRGEGSVVPPGSGDGGGGARTGDVAWHVTLDPVVPAELAGLLPVLAPLRALALPVAPVLDVGFSSGPGVFMEPVRATLSAELGQGELRSGGSALRVASGTVLLQASRPAGPGGPGGPGGAVALRLLQADLQLRAVGDADGAAPTGPLLRAHGTLSLDRLAGPRRIGLALTADIPRIGFADLADDWPAGLAAAARRWITGNITAGEARGLHVESRLDSDTGWSGLAETARTGGFDADGLTLWWLRPIAPLRDMQARLTFQGPDAVLIEVPHAVMPVETPHAAKHVETPHAAIHVETPPAAMPAGIAGGAGHAIAVSGSMRIAGLTAPEQVGTVGLHLDGDLGDLLAELSHPRLRLLSAHPVPFTAPSGRSRTDVEVVLPLDSDVSIDAIRVRARSQMTDVHLGNVVTGRSLDRASLAVTADTEGLSVDGSGLVGSIPAQLHYAMDFRSGPPSQVIEDAHVEGVVTTDALRREGLDPSDNLGGSGRLTVGYAARRSGASTVSLGLDMTGLDIVTPIWSKRRGEAADASATIALEHGRLAAIDQIRATGPGLAVEARAAVSDGRARQVVVGRFTVGRSRGAGRIDLPEAAGRAGRSAPIRVSAQGAVLDLAGVVGGQAPRRHPPAAAPARRAAAAASPPPRWVADLAFDRVFVGPRTAMTGLVAHVEDDGRRIAAARLDVAGPTPLSVALTTQAGGRHVTGTAADTGRLLGVLGVTDALSGGALRLDGRFDDLAPGTPLAGTVEIGRFVVLDAPLAARIVRNLSIYGWLTALPSPQLGVDRLTAPFTFQDKVLTLADAQAHSAALGVTLRGPIDLGRRTFDLKGTVVPAWAVNHLPGRLPLVGRLLSPERGGGLLAATLTIQGPLASPDVHVNALSALAPGVLRQLLFE